jgi:hypothetical protein
VHCTSVPVMASWPLLPNTMGTVRLSTALLNADGLRIQSRVHADLRSGVGSSELSLSTNSISPRDDHFQPGRLEGCLLRLVWSYSLLSYSLLVTSLYYYHVIMWHKGHSQTSAQLVVLGGSRPACASIIIASSFQSLDAIPSLLFSGAFPRWPLSLP